VNILGLYQPFKIDLKHQSHVPDKNIFHVFIGLTLVFLPNIVTDISFNYESIFSKLV
jgi:hypothetical protein